MMCKECGNECLVKIFSETYCSVKCRNRAVERARYEQKKLWGEQSQLKGGIGT